LRAGASLPAALDQPGLAWPPYVQALLQAGEASGEMAQALNDSAAQMAQELATAAELRNALVYPAVLVLAGVGAVLFIFVGVVPRFAGIVKSARADVPEISRWVIEAGVAMQQNLGAIGLGAAAVAAVVASLAGQPAMRAAVLQAMAALPAIGPWLRSVDVGRWALVMGALLANRVPIVEALRLSAGTLRLKPLREGLLRGGAQLQQGRALSEVLEQQAWFPAMRLSLVRVGERSGELPRMLRALGEAETQGSRNLQKRVLALVEPVAILVIGGVIGVIMVAVMMAITSLNTVAG
jgi:general secretion pathway protein F